MTLLERTKAQIVCARASAYTSSRSRKPTRFSRPPPTNECSAQSSRQLATRATRCNCGNVGLSAQRCTTTYHDIRGHTENITLDAEATMKEAAWIPYQLDKWEGERTENLLYFCTRPFSTTTQAKRRVKPIRAQENWFY